MGATSGERYAVVSCHVERPLDDAVWARFSALQQRRPGGFAIAALMRPADPAAGEDEPASGSSAPARRRQLAARSATTRTGRRPTTRDRPVPGTGARVLAEGARLRELGLAPTLFCGGGWYTDEDVAEACAELGYVDCTPRATRPPYLAAGERWASLAGARARRAPVGANALRAIPTTHSLGDLGACARAALRCPTFVHVYFHDTDLLDRRRSRASAASLLGLLARRARRHRPRRARGRGRRDAPRVAWDDVARL